MASSDRSRLHRTRWLDPALVTATLALLAALALMSGCAATAPVVPPVAAAARVSDDFGGVRRCVDNLLLDHGIREVSIAVDELSDSARPGSGARELLVSALSDMTQRSRALRVVGGRDGAQYLLRGAIRPEGASGLGLDLTLLSGRDTSVVPGTASHNSVAVLAPAADREGRVELRKFGAQFAVATGNDGAATRATRTLLELGAVETLGRVAKVPYWTCFGASVDYASVAGEIQDWYDAMAARPAELIGFFQERLRQRRLYDGPVDGAVNPALKDAVARYREALGLSREAKLSLDFFRAWLGADHAAIAERLAPAAPPASPSTPGGTALAAAPSTATPAAIPTAAPVTAPGTSTLGLRVATSADPQRMPRGEKLRLTVRPTRDAHVYCYHQDENRRISRFFPNRFQPDSRVPAAVPLQLPGAMRFEIVMNAKGVPEAIACFATEQDVLAQLPATVAGADFEALPVASLDQVRSAFAKAAGAVAQESLQLRSR